MMLMTRKPVSVGAMLKTEFLEPMGLTQSKLASATTLPRKHINELCNDRRAVTADTALILARVFGNTPDFWLNVQRRSDIWEALHSPERRERIERAQPLSQVQSRHQIRNQGSRRKARQARHDATSFAPDIELAR